MRSPNSCGPNGFRRRQSRPRWPAGPRWHALPARRRCPRGSPSWEPHPYRVEEPHRRQGLGLVGLRVAHRAGVPDLSAHRRALGVDRLGEPPQPGHGLRAHPQSVALGAPAPGDRAVGDGRHADPAGRRQPVVLDEVIGNQRVGCARFERRSLDDPVAQRQRTELGRTEHIRRGRHIGSVRGDRARLSGVGAITLDGKATRDEIFVDLKERVAALTVAGRTPGLGTILVGDDPESQAYVRGKHADCAKVGITSIRRDLPADISAGELDATIDELNGNPECTGYIVQLPLPKHLDENAALERVDPAKDADGLHPTNLGRLVLSTPAPLPCTARGIVHLLRRYDIEIAGAHVVVMGRGVTVGRPLGLLLTRRSENATVTLCHTGTRDLPALTRQADIIVAAVGVPHLLTADMVRPGAAVVDVGVSRTEDGLVGDVHPEVWEVAGHVSPNPGGVGPLTRAFLLTNVVELAEGR